ncbi:MAG: hypothetical protein PHS59_10480 [Paludibacter sp.]|nr:hypothetical protein [Paludibacter sp.]
MNEQNNRKTYSKPQIGFIKLDNEISLTLDSIPPYGPGEVQNKLTPDYFNNPFKTDIA